MKKTTEYLTIDEIHSALLNILVEFDRICRKHALKYSLAFGTLIGAVRHKGFIPWDDDVDVIMPRPDYEKFYRIVNGDELKAPFLISDDRGKKAMYPFLKLMDGSYSIKTWSHREVPYLYIDIFPLDGASDDEKELKKQYRRRFKYNALAALSRWAVPDRKRYLILRFLGFPFYLAGAIYGSSRATKNANKYALNYDYEKCSRCGCFTFSDANWVMDRDKLMGELIELPFEGKSFLCTKAYDENLTLLYGNYMKLPPEDERITHGLKVKSNEKN